MNSVAKVPAQSRSVTFTIRVSVSQEGIPRSLIIHTILSVLRSSGCFNIHLDRPANAMQADYEDRRLEISGKVSVLAGRMDAWQVIIKLTSKFCAETGMGLEMQPFLEVEAFDRYFDEITPNHDNCHILWFAFGSMPNDGLFVTRGDYISGYNKRSNKLIPDRGYNVNYVAGTQHLLSWGHFEHDRRVLTIYFAVTLRRPSKDGLLYKGYKVVFNYKSILSVIADTDATRGGNNVVYLKLRHPPQLWQAVPRLYANRRLVNLEACRDWIRAFEFPGNFRYYGCSRETLGQSSVFAFAMPKNVIGPKVLFEEEKAEWKAFSENLKTKENPTRTLFDILSRLKRKANVRLSFGSILSVARPVIKTCDLPQTESFRVNYCLEALSGRGFTVTDQWFPLDTQEVDHVPIFFSRILWCLEECREAVEGTLESMLSIFDERKNHLNMMTVFEHLYSQRMRSLLEEGVKDERNLTLMPSNCVMVRKVVVMPSRTLLMPPEVMMTNRVIRHFGEENALRCVFRDDAGNKLVPKEFSRGCSVHGQSRTVRELVRSTLSNGILISGRLYQFLAWSNSQMRDHGCYMYANSVVRSKETGEAELLTINHIRNWMGDFSSSRNVPKLMSRMGQCFTQAQPTIRLESSHWRVDKDYYTGPAANPKMYCFSDGVGRISLKFAERIALIMNLYPAPSCFQVRYRGFKGVLCVDPQLDKSDDTPIVFRESQMKFIDNDGSDQGPMLEIVKYAMPSPTCLNRPLIMILDQVAEKQGAECHRRVCSSIHKTLENELNALTVMLYSEEAAIFALTQRVNLSIDFTQFSNTGIRLTEEPFLRSLLLAIHKYNIRQQLSKAKIPIPHNMGRTMYGVMDEYGVLEYGQVFVQYSQSISSAGQQKVLHRGRVMVTKNPCHVAGDVRIFDAVHHPYFDHLVDVIVFPRNGPRPHPDEMAGSDLDGDEYTVIFDTNLFFETNEPAMEFPKSEAPDFDAMPQTKDMVAFFLKYLEQDSIGRMSNAHLVMADKLGLFDEICNSIARKCSVAVDFPKSGQPAEPLHIDEQCADSPDYMKSSTKPSYLSKRLVGQLYRKAKAIEDIVDLMPMSADRQIICDDDFNAESYLRDNPQVVRECVRLRNAYNFKLQQLLDEYAIGDEASLITGHITSMKRLTEMEKDDYTFYHTDRIVELRYGKIFSLFREKFFEEFGCEEDHFYVHADGKKDFKANEGIMRKACCWYTVTYGTYGTGKNERFLSFPWVLWDILVAVKKTKNLQKKWKCPIESPLAERLTTMAVNKCKKEEKVFAEFCNNIQKNILTIKCYRANYGDNFLKSCYVLNSWLLKEQFYEKSGITEEQLAVLFLQFGLAIRHGSLNSAEGDHPRIFQKMVVMNKSYVEIKPDGPVLSGIGIQILEFLRYLAGYDFMFAEKIDLNLGSVTESTRITARNCSWKSLSLMAFKVFHHITLSSSFRALHCEPAAVGGPEDRRFAWDYGEMDNPLIIHKEALMMNMPGMPPIHLESTLNIIQSWCGVDDLMVRSLNRRDLLIVSCAGSAESRQMLRKLLLLPPDVLRHAILTDTVPQDVVGGADI
ncbi:hypothetical protein QR680_004350 [Steinernema hermaphroditum]|uniref:RNA-directed RNA polymerase n=1 Tax=Steinernema hermaphroditum TaxID=289476 RepID=A0AA39HQN3_9BILA|nr:hypothetical protein QR680_004350 [Steinernema hermaphroditum]